MQALELEERVATGVKPRLGFVGVGWIGRNRMEAMVREAAVDVAVIAEPSAELARAAGEAAPGALVVDRMEDLLQEDLDGVVIATPSALHAEQTIQALEAGLAVFCQKPLGRSAAETRSVVEAARRADRLLGVDLSYRHVGGLRRMKEIVQSGEIGDVFAANLVFHNAYGPGKAWFYDRRLSGGGCVIDLGIHLVDLALWVLGFPSVEDVEGRLFSKGRPLSSAPDQVEDYATVRLDLEGGTAVDVACSWNLAAGALCAIEVSVYGTNGGVRMRNVDGSYFDFITEQHKGTERWMICGPPDDWGGRAAVTWARQLAVSNRFDPEVEQIVTVAETLDRIYGLS